MADNDAPWSELGGRCFLSHSYADAEAVQLVAGRLEDLGAEPVIFELVDQDPENPVSNDIVPTILSCDALIYLKGGRSGSSFWVAFEKDYALRSGLSVYAADADATSIKKINERPMDLSIYTVFHQSDGDRVERLFRWMREERHFELTTTNLRLRLGAMSGDAAVSLEEMLIHGGVALYLCGTRSVATLEYFYGPPFEDLLERSFDFRERFRARRLAEFPESDNPEDLWELEEGSYFDEVDPYEYLFGVFSRIDPELPAETRPIGFPLLDLLQTESAGTFHWNRIDDLIIRLFAALRDYQFRLLDDQL